MYKLLQRNNNISHSYQLQCLIGSFVYLNAIIIIRKLKLYEVTRMNDIVLKEDVKECNKALLTLNMYIDNLILVIGKIMYYNN